MIDLGTLAGLHEHQHELAAYCLHCDRWAVIDLAGMVAARNGERRPPFRARRQISGGAGRPQVRPPLPNADQAR